MPIYEYRCCRLTTEVYTASGAQRSSPPVCSTCGQPMERIMSAPAVHFKGKGFYHNDYGPGKSRTGD